MAVKGSVTIPLKDYDRLMEIKQKYMNLLEFCSKEVEYNAKRLDKYVDSHNECMLHHTILNMREICNVTGWSCADVDDANVQFAKEKLERIMEIESNSGYQE